MKPSAQKVQDALAAALGCTVGQIAKSLVFRGLRSGGALLVIASGAHRVDEALVAAALGEPIGKADAQFVRDQTGFVIGGVPPVGHARPLPTLVDEALSAHAVIWAAAGHPYAVFRLTPAELAAITKGRVVRLAASEGGGGGHAPPGAA